MNQPATLTPRPMVLAYLEDHPKILNVLRAARKHAQEQNAKWCAVYVETPRIAASDDIDAHERMLRQLTIAEQMGGEIRHIEASSLEDGLRKVLEAEKNRLSLCVVGVTEARQKWKFWQKPTSWQRALDVASDYGAVETVPLSGASFTRSWPRLRPVPPRHFAYSLAAVTMAYIGALLMQWWMPPALFIINSQNVIVLFLIACTFAAGRYGLLPGLFAAVIGFFTANISFPELFHGFSFSNITDTLNIALFLLAAVLVAMFTRHAYAYVERMEQREVSTQALFTLYRIAATSFTRKQALEKLQQKLTHMLKMDVAFFLPTALNPTRIELAYPTGLTLDEADQKALEASWSEMKTKGLAAPGGSASRWRFEPMQAPGGEVGVLGVRPPEGKKLSPWYGRMLSAIADQTAAVLEHIELERSMESSRLSEEREKLRSMLLSSVSHDLKTPLSGIIGALSAVSTLQDRLPPAKRTDLLETALEEAHRLDTFITNILEMTKLENKKIELRQEWHKIDKLVTNIHERMEHRLQRHPLTIHPFPPDVEVYMDSAMVSQVLQNLLDNACKYTQPGVRIEIMAAADSAGYRVEVRDYGEGLPPDKLNVAFDKYARLHKKDSQVAGTGLGLAICRALMQAQGGTITAANHPQGGAVFTLTLPQWRNIQSATNPAPEEAKSYAHVR